MKQLIIIMFFLTSSVTFTQFKEWERSYNGSGNGSDQASMIAVDNQGNIIVCGRTISTGNNTDFCTIKYNPSGTQLWAAVYNGAANDYDEPYGMTVDNSGNVYVTGMTRASTQYDIVTIKYNSSGDQQWAQIWAGSSGFDDRSSAIYADATGNIYVTGQTEITSSINFNYITLKYNPTGSLQWAKQYNEPSNRGDIALFIKGDGNNVYVTGNSASQLTGNDFLTIKYNANGDSLWTARNSGTVNINEIPYGFDVDASGNVYVTGMTQGTNSGIDFITIKYNTSGVEQWQAIFTSPGNSQDIPEGLTVDGNGNVYVTGRTRFNSSYNDFGTVKYNSSGVQQWVAIYDNAPESRDDYGYDIITDAQGNVYVTGNSQATGSDRDVLTIKYNSAGIEQWVARYDSANSEEAYSIALDANNNVYVTGYQSLGNSNFLTLKYSQVNGITPVSNEIPSEFELSQNYPNPFNPKTLIKFSIPKTGNVKIALFDILGREIVVLVNDFLTTGSYTVDFDASGFSSGVYFYSLISGDFTATKKMMLIK